MTDANGESKDSPSRSEAGNPPPQQFDLDAEYPEFKGWEAIGFHRGIGREFWQIIIELFTAALGIVIVSLLMPIFKPFPQVDGYQGIAGGVFLLVYKIFDLGTNFGLGRFVAEYRVKNVRKMMQYVSFTIWWQSFTGLIQITILSFFTFQVLVNSQFAYVIWILLLGLQMQYPGWLGTFRYLLEGLQHFDKVEVLRFFQNQVVERLTMLGFVLLFRYYGESDPSTGILMWVIYGNIIGSYIDDVALEIASGYYLNKILHRYFGLSLRDAFQTHYDHDVLKDIVKYSLQGSVLPLLGSVVDTYVFFTYVAEINAYATWTALIGTGMGFAGQLGQFGDFALETGIAESYPNGKKKLAEFYASNSIKWRFYFMIMLTFVLLAVLPYFNIVVRELGAYQYFQGAEQFMIAGIINRLLWVLVVIPDAIMWGAKHITAHNIIRVGEEFGKVFFTWLFVVVLRIQETWGTFGLVYLIGFTHFVPIMIKTAICDIYVEKRIMHVKVYWYTTVIVPVVASLPNIAIAQFWYYTGFFPMKAAIGLVPAIAISIGIFFLIIIFTYFPLTAILGGFDDYQLFMFKKAVDLSGPSKILFRPVYRLVEKGIATSRKLKLHGRYPIPYEDALKEIRELMEIKRVSLQTNKK